METLQPLLARLRAISTPMPGGVSTKLLRWGCQDGIVGGSFEIGGGAWVLFTYLETPL